MDVGLDDSVNFGSNQILFIIFISCLPCASVSLWLARIFFSSKSRSSVHDEVAGGADSVGLVFQREPQVLSAGDRDRFRCSYQLAKREAECAGPVREGE